MTEIIDLEMSAESAAAGQVEIAVPVPAFRYLSLDFDDGAQMRHDKGGVFP